MTDPAQNSGSESRDQVKRMSPLLLNRHEAAAALGVSARTFDDLINETWMPRPIRLGPRLLRWSIAELQEAILTMPRQVGRQESVRAQIERLKRGSEK